MCLLRVCEARHGRACSGLLVRPPEWQRACTPVLCLVNITRSQSTMLSLGIWRALISYWLWLQLFRPIRSSPSCSVGSCPQAVCPRCTAAAVPGPRRAFRGTEGIKSWANIMGHQFPHMDVFVERRRWSSGCCDSANLVTAIRLNCFHKNRAPAEWFGLFHGFS